MAIYRRSGVNTEGICYKSVGCYLYIYTYICMYKAVKTICSKIYFISFGRSAPHMLQVKLRPLQFTNKCWNIPIGSQVKTSIRQSLISNAIQQNISEQFIMHFFQYTPMAH